MPASQTSRISMSSSIVKKWIEEDGPDMSSQKLLPLSAVVIPASPSTTIDSEESFQCRGPNMTRSNGGLTPIPREPIVWASGIKGATA
ncbi:hypothetical protein PGT21_000109 [Puccinia graminis f. sp. tritici]|uniref:Uncharacterized protein n=1 Tax=Puccinia graminis f. sp. tritici TaxID=56615 RepID=A0A5B0MRR8_PUCGR|nr:hypothetical protein PGT21_000109 [Puccinia graminis f. sp. tritici]